MEVGNGALKIHSFNSKKMNIFERKFNAWRETLNKKNNAGHSEAAHTEAAGIFEDKPYSTEYRRVYHITKAGQILAQVVTFSTTAGLGAFALEHVILADWGRYITVPLALLFAAGIEAVKRSTLAISAKHLLKYKTFGAVGIFAVFTLCVSVLFALWGAKELPGQFYAKPERQTDKAGEMAIQAEINAIQADIDRTQNKLKDGANWTAENKTLPRLQKQRAALMERREQAARDAEQRADASHSMAEADRAEKVGRMQFYAIAAAATAEGIFLACTLFIFYYLFRCYAETQNDTEPDGAPETAPSERPQFSTNGHNANGATNGHNVKRFTDAGAIRETSARTRTHADEKRTCEHCQRSYIYGHARQKFCSENCRVLAWQKRNGKTLRHRVNIPNAG